MLGGYARTAAELGAESAVVELSAADGVWRGTRAPNTRSVDLAEVKEEPPFDLICSSLTPDPAGKSLVLLVRTAVKAGAATIIADAPTDYDLQAGSRAAAQAGYA